MKILHVCLAAFYIDGFGYQENILPRIHKRIGHEVEIVASTETYVGNIAQAYVEAGSYVNTDNIQVHRLAYKNWLPKKFRPKIRAYVGLEGVLKKSAPDLIFVHDVQFFDLMKICAYARMTGARVVADCHTDEVNSARGWLSEKILHGIFYRFIAQKCDRDISKYFPTLPLRGDFLQRVYGLPTHKMQLLPFGADDVAVSHLDRGVIKQEVRKSLGIGEAEFVFVTGGKLDTRKNIHKLIEVFSRLRRDGGLQGAHLVVFGQPDDQVKKLLNSIAIDENVHLVGWCESSEVYRYFWCADFALFPGTHSVLWEEAIGHGLGAAFLRWSGMEHLDLGGNAAFIEQGSETDIVELLENLSNNDYYKARSLTSFARVKGPYKFAYSAIAEQSLL